LKITDVVRGTIGTGEAMLKNMFQQAKQAAPSVIFIDEFQVRQQSYY
jgi:ATP-dependent 26S proteasome regulatory subunit